MCCSTFIVQAQQNSYLLYWDSLPKSKQYKIIKNSVSTVTAGEEDVVVHNRLVGEDRDTGYLLEINGKPYFFKDIEVDSLERCVLYSGTLYTFSKEAIDDAQKERTNNVASFIIIPLCVLLILLFYYLYKRAKKTLLSISIFLFLSLVGGAQVSAQKWAERNWDEFSAKEKWEISKNKLDTVRTSGEFEIYKVRFDSEKVGFLVISEEGRIGLFEEMKFLSQEKYILCTGKSYSFDEDELAAIYKKRLVKKYLW